MTMFSLNSHDGLNAASNLVFKSSDVLTSKREKLRRKAGILRAMMLDSSHQEAVTLTVEDQTSVKILRGRVVAAADDHVMMERGLVLPVRCIRRIEFLQ